MAKSTLEIIIQMVKKGGGDKEAVSALNDIKRAFTTGLAVVGSVTVAMAALDRFLSATAGKYVNYATNVDVFSSALSTTTREGSRLIQVADDFEISSDSMQQAMFRAVKEGIEPTVEGLAQAADHYNSLTTAQEKADYMQSTFGKGSQDLARLLEEGGAAIRARADDIQKGLVLDDAAILKARQYKEQIDEFQDMRESIMITIGANILPGLIGFMEWYNKVQGGIEETNKNPIFGGQGGAIMAQVERMSTMNNLMGTISRHGNDFYNSLTGSDIAIRDIADASGQFDFLLKAAEGYQKINDEIADINAKIAAATAAGAAKSVLDDLNADLDAAKAKSAEFTNQMILDLVRVNMAADGITEKEISKFFNLAESFGVIGDAARVAAEQALQVAVNMGLIPGEVNSVINVHTKYMTSGSQASVGTGGGFGMRAGGGDLPDSAIVGEAGWEAIVRRPDGGYTVIPHEMSMWMQQQGLLNGAPGFRVGTRTDAINVLRQNGYPNYGTPETGAVAAPAQSVAAPAAAAQMATQAQASISQTNQAVQTLAQSVNQVASGQTEEIRALRHSVEALAEQTAAAIQRII